jgi:NitT/TauT family transport system substrate-binding protein
MSTRTPRALLALLGALVVAVALAACGTSDTGSSSSSKSSSSASSIPAKPEPGTFKMGIEPWLGYGPWRVAERKGYFTQAGLSGVKITNFTTDDQINAALASGKLDGANIATHTALRLAAAGLPIKAVLLEDESTTADAILAGPGITSIKGLKGKKVAYEEGTTSDILLQHALAENGMTIKDVKKVPLAAADAGAAVIAGKVDVAVTYEPYLTAALKQKKGFKLLYTAGQDPGLVGDVLVVRQDVLKRKPGQVLALLKAWNKAVGYYTSHSADAQAIITKAVGAKPGELTTAFKGVKIYSLADNASQLHGAYVTKTIQDVKKAADQAGLIKGSIDPKSLVVSSFVDKATGK